MNYWDLLLDPRTDRRFFWGMLFNWNILTVNFSSRIYNAVLGLQCLIVVTILVVAVGLIVESVSGRFEWQRAMLGVVFGICVGIGFWLAFRSHFGTARLAAAICSVPFSIAFGICHGVTRDVSAGLYVGVAIGVAEGVAFPAGFSVSQRAVSGLAFSLGGGVAGAAGASIYRVGNTMGGGFVSAMISTFLILFLIKLLSFGAHRAIASWRIRRQAVEWLLAVLLLIGWSIGLGTLLPTLHPILLSGSSVRLSADTVSTLALAAVFALVYTRLPLWPMEALYGILGYRRLIQMTEERLDDVDPGAMARTIGDLFFDKQMILPLPGEAPALRRLAELDETLATRMAAQLILFSNRQLTAIAVLRYIAARNPLLVQQVLCENISRGNFGRNLDYIATDLPEVAARVWIANRRFLELCIDDIDPRIGNFSRKVETLDNFPLILEEFAAAHAQKPDLPHVATHLALYRSLVAAVKADDITEVAGVDVPALPANVPVLYPARLRNVLTQVAVIANYGRGYVEATSPVTQGRHLLDAQKALLEVKEMPVAGTLPFVFLIALILGHWERLFAEAGGELVRVQTAGPVSQPYVIANPVVGDGFVGREDVLRRLEALWAVPGQRPSVVLYGHRRMGKSSILQNLCGEQFGADTRIVDFNLQTYGLVPSTAALLHNLALQLHDACHRGDRCPEPDEASFRSEPYGAFKRFLARLDRDGRRLIVTMDEFETLEKRIRSGYLQADLIDYLRGVITTEPWLTLAFAGLHTLREMTEDYWHPLYGSVEAIPVTFLTAGATRRLLTAPTPDFAVDYDRDALERIYALTHGQPYLTQLIGHSLVTRLNEQMFEEQVERALRFDLADVETVIAADIFYRTGGAYFRGIWAQAAEGPSGQQAILEVLADGPATEAEILARTGASLESAGAALRTLESHDVIVAIDEAGVRRWRCTVELMRRWLGRLGNRPTPATPRPIPPEVPPTSLGSTLTAP